MTPAIQASPHFLTMERVIRLLGKASFYHAVPAFSSLLPKVQALDLKIKSMQAGSHGCGQCVVKKTVLQEYLKLYTLFTDIYCELWQLNPAALEPLPRYLGVEEVRLPLKGPQQMPVKRGLS
jgi:hypothetical protein